MKPTLHDIKRIFDKYNRDYFGCELPLPMFRMAHSKRFVGRFLANRIKSYNVLCEQTIEISDYFDFKSWDNLVDTVLHEMIHYVIAYRDINDDSTHGREFQRIANELNRKGGHHITISDRVNEMTKPIKSHIVLCDFKKDPGKYVMIKTTLRYIEHYAKTLPRVGGIGEVKYIVTMSPKIAMIKTNLKGKTFSYNTIDKTVLNEVLDGYDHYTCNIGIIGKVDNI